MVVKLRCVCMNSLTNIGARIMFTLYTSKYWDTEIDCVTEIGLNVRIVLRPKLAKV